MAATSLKLPEDLKRRIERLASAANKTPHAFMVEALAREAERSELRARFCRRCSTFRGRSILERKDVRARSHLRVSDGARVWRQDAPPQGPCMATVEITQRALTDLERLFDFIAAENPQKAREQVLSVRRAFELLAEHPLLGRSAEQGRRELVLSRGRYGYIAKYLWLPAEDVVLILAVRHQLEAGYAGD